MIFFSVFLFFSSNLDDDDEEEVNLLLLLLFSVGSVQNFSVEEFQSSDWRPVDTDLAPPHALLPYWIILFFRSFVRLLECRIAVVVVPSWT